MWYVTLTKGEKMMLTINQAAYIIREYANEPETEAKQFKIANEGSSHITLRALENYLGFTLSIDDLEMVGIYE